MLQKIKNTASGACLSVQQTQFTLPAHGRMRVDPPESKYYGQFVYETGTMTPLAAARKSHKSINKFMI